MKITTCIRWVLNTILLFFIWSGKPRAVKLGLTLALIGVELLSVEAARNAENKDRLD